MLDQDDGCQSLSVRDGMGVAIVIIGQHWDGVDVIHCLLEMTGWVSLSDDTRDESGCCHWMTLGWGHQRPSSIRGNWVGIVVITTQR